MIQMNLFTKYRLTDLLENEFMVATVVGGGGSRMRERILREAWRAAIHGSQRVGHD